jgi:hypothetical protein
MSFSHEERSEDKRPGFRWVLLVLDFMGRAGVALLTWPFHGVALWYRELKFIRQMREKGRFIPWPQLEPRLQNGEGTLIVEQARYERIRVWWTPGDVLRTVPKPPLPSEDELDYDRRDRPHPFVSWCFKRYLHPDSGLATLTRPPSDYPGGIVKAAFFNNRYQASRVVMTVRCA